MKPLIASVAVFLCALSAIPAFGGDDDNRWPHSVGGAIAAKVIGERCPGSLTSSQIADIDTYLAKAASQWPSTMGQLKFDDFSRSSIDSYEVKYSDTKACDAASTEEARDALQFVQNVIASGKPIFPAGQDPGK